MPDAVVQIRLAPFPCQFEVSTMRHSNFRRTKGILAALAISGAVIACSKASEVALKRDRLVTINLSRDPGEQKKQIAALARFDLAHIDRQHATAEVIASRADTLLLSAQGLTVASDLPADSRLALEEAQVEKYLSPDQVLSKLKELASLHPDIVEYRTIGYSHQGREIGAVVLTAPGTAEEKHRRPVLHIDGMHHARELMTTEVVTEAVIRVTSHWSRTPLYAESLRNFRLVFVPQVNPDGNALVRTKDAYWRKNAFSLAGEIKGVDLNRNYPVGTESCQGSADNPDSPTYRGPSEASEPETQAMIKLVEEMRPLAALTYHSTGGLILFPPGCLNEKNSSMSQFIEIGSAVKSGIIDDSGRPGTYLLGSTSSTLYDADGTSRDWMWETFGTLALTVELNDKAGFLAHYDTWRDLTVERQVPGWEAFLRYANENLYTVSMEKELTDKYSVVECGQTPNANKRPLAEALRNGGEHITLLTNRKVYCLLSEKAAPSLDEAEVPEVSAIVSATPILGKRDVVLSIGSVKPYGQKL